MIRMEIEYKCPSVEMGQIEHKKLELTARPVRSLHEHMDFYLGFLYFINYRAFTGGWNYGAGNYDAILEL